MVKDLQTNGEIEQDKDYSGGFAEDFQIAQADLFIEDDYDFDNQSVSSGHLKS